MTRYIPNANPKDLLPPLLACLPLAFVSPHPPPALLPLLSPILRQRVQILSGSTTQPPESWLPLLCWDRAQVSRIADIVESNTFEAHPVSGEVEYEDAADVHYRRLDEETLQSKVTLSSLGLMVIYVWCQEGEDSSEEGWRVSELLSVEATMNMGSSPWCKSIDDVDQMRRRDFGMDSLTPEDALTMNGSAAHGISSVGDADDDYWAQYDNSGSRTPAIKPSPAGPTNPDANTYKIAVSDADYYAQYAQVQPALDRDDPSEGTTDIGRTSMSENITATSRPAEGQGPKTFTLPAMEDPNISANEIFTGASYSLSTAVPVEHLESSAVSRLHAEVAIQQHISTSLKSLFRLAQATGIELEEFDRLVRAELDTLNILVDDVQIYD
jgi:hypothetical protein